MILGLLVFVVVLIVAPWWAALAAGVLVYLFRALTASHRKQARAQRMAEISRHRQAARAVRRDERRAAIRDRTGLDVDLVGRAAQDAVHAVGSRITKRLEARYPDTSPEPDSGDWLDLDTDLGALRSRTQTEQALRLNDELGRSHRQ